MKEMDKILDMGYSLSLSPWWFQNNTTEKEFEKMREHITRPDDWINRIRILWNWDNLLYINNVPAPAGVDLFELRRRLEMRRYAKPRPPAGEPRPQYYETDAYWAAVNAYEPLVRTLLKSSPQVRTQDRYLREKLTAQRRSMPVSFPAPPPPKTPTERIGADN